MKAKILLLTHHERERADADVLPVLEALEHRFGHELRVETATLPEDVEGVERWPLLAHARTANAILATGPGNPAQHRALEALASRLDLFASVRQVRVFPERVRVKTALPEVARQIDVLLVSGTAGAAAEQGDAAIRRVVEVGFSLAASRWGHVTSVDAANVLSVSPRWKALVAEVGAEHSVQLEHQPLDSAAVRLVTSPSAFDVIVASRVLADVLLEQAGVLAGSLELLPGAWLGENRFGLYHPISGVDAAGHGHPLAKLLSVALMLRTSLRLDREATLVEAAVARAITDAPRTGEDAPVPGAAVLANLVADVTSSMAV